MMSKQIQKTYYTPRFIYATDQEFQEHYQNNIWNFSYLDRNIRNLFSRTPGVHKAIFAFFDKDGYLIKSYGSEDTLRDFEESGIKPKAIWTLKYIGANAVTIGLKDRISISSIGSENSHPLLQNLALYFAPISINAVYNQPQKASVELNLGGIAAMVPVEYQTPDYMLTVASFTHDIEMTLYFNQMANRLYEQEKSGLLIIDTCMYQGKSTVTYASDTLFKVLGIPPIDLGFKPLNIFLKPDENPEFWQLIKKGLHVNGVSMPLKVYGKKIYCIITSYTFNQPRLHAEGIIAYITTPQIESRKISKKMGNAAVLSFANIIGQSTCIQSAIQRATLISNTDSNVMILGESGVGKDIFAQAIHNASRRRNKPFIVVNCGSLPRELIASELFGYDGGAFTGARKNGNIGKFELANGGTIFLDEIGDLPLDLQATLLRVVEKKQLMRLGGNQLIDIDVKIICATNADIHHMVKQKLFRSDLFFRLSTLKLSLPPLREREGDIILLANHFIHSICKRIQREKPITLSTEAEELLKSLPWQGNVRELQNLMECIVQLYSDDIILPRHIIENMYFESFSTTTKAISITPPVSTLPHRRKSLTLYDIEEAINKCHGNRSKAADYLKISRKTLYRYIEKYEISTHKNNQNKN